MLADNPIVNALFPVVVLLMIGWCLKRVVLTKDTDWDNIDRIVYYVLFPSLIISELAKVSTIDAPIIPLLVILGTAQLIMFLVSFVAWIKPGMTAPRFTSIIQTNVLVNNYVAITIIEGSQGGKQAGAAVIAMATVASTAMLPIANILSIWALLIWGDPTKVHDKGSMKPILELFKSPILIACAIGIALQFSHIKIPELILSPLEIMGKATLPLGILATGAGLNLSLMRENYAERFAWAGIRLFVFPIVVILCCHLFGVGDILLLHIVLVTACAPTASNSYILSRQLGGDATFMAAMVATTTVLSLVTIPLLMHILPIFGFL